MVFYNNTDAPGKENSQVLSDDAKSCLDKPIDELELSVRSRAVLMAVGITTVRELVSHTEAEMLKYRNFGRKSLRELQDVLAEMDLEFGMEL